MTKISSFTRSKLVFRVSLGNVWKIEKTSRVSPEVMIYPSLVSIDMVDLSFGLVHQLCLSADAIADCFIDYNCFMRNSWRKMVSIIIYRVYFPKYRIHRYTGSIHNFVLESRFSGTCWHHFHRVLRHFSPFHLQCMMRVVLVWVRGFSPWYLRRVHRLRHSRLMRVLQSRWRKILNRMSLLGGFLRGGACEVSFFA